MSAFQDVARAVAEAKAANQAVDENVAAMVRLIAGRLRNATPDYATTLALKRLKRELRSFNSTSGTWVDQ